MRGEDISPMLSDKPHFRFSASALRVAWGTAMSLSKSGLEAPRATRKFSSSAQLQGQRFSVLGVGHQLPGRDKPLFEISLSFAQTNSPTTTITFQRHKRAKIRRLKVPILAAVVVRR